MCGHKANSIHLMYHYSTYPIVQCTSSWQIFGTKISMTWNLDYMAQRHGWTACVFSAGRRETCGVNMWLYRGARMARIDSSASSAHELTTLFPKIKRQEWGEGGGRERGQGREGGREEGRMEKREKHISIIIFSSRQIRREKRRKGEKESERGKKKKKKERDQEKTKD